MSYSIDVKNEILKNDNLSRHCAIAETYGLLQNNYKINFGKTINISFNTDNVFFAKRMMYLSSNYYKLKTEVKVTKKSPTNKNLTYYGVIENCYSMLKSIDIIDADKVFRPNRLEHNKLIIKNNCCRGAYLRSEFIICGSISNPNKNYHLEFMKSSENDAKNLQKILNIYHLNSKVVKRKGHYVVYVKEGDKISDFLNIIGTYSNLLLLESLMVEKDVRNNINRKQNCEMSNMNKTISAGVKQITDIEYIIEKKGLNYLPEELLEIAKIRLSSADLSLIEISNLTTSASTKSSVNYRLKKITKIAENLRRD